MFSSSLSFAIVLAILSNVSAVPQPIPRIPGISMDLLRRSRPARTTEDWGVWAKNQKDLLVTKYGGTLKPQVQKRSSGTNLITNQNADSSFFGSLAIGTPPVSFDVILDTGSADLWVASSDCDTGCGQVPSFSSTASSTFQNKSTPFSITYGSGQAAGTLGEDVVQMAGFSVPNQVFAVCDQVSSGLLNNPVSGLIGLAFNNIASSGAIPLWQTLASAPNTWDSPVMSFQLSRYLDDSKAQNLEPGGSFTMGFVNESLYTGNIDFQNIPNGQESYWILPMTTITAQGNTISLPTGSSSFSAIDTGTTLVGGPSQAISQLFAQIPGSAPGTGNLEGYYTYPCNTQVQVSLSFGGQSWPVSPQDFKLAQMDGSQCLGAFFELETGESAPSWIVGDTFLKNVYSVFRFNPPSVGFAQLSATATAQNGAVAKPPTATIGADVTAVASSSSASVSGDRIISSATLVSSSAVMITAAATFLAVALL